jgi:hypothetical protein
MLIIIDYFLTYFIDIKIKIDSVFKKYIRLYLYYRIDIMKNRIKKTTNKPNITYENKEEMVDLFKLIRGKIVEKEVRGKKISLYESKVEEIQLLQKYIKTKGKDIKTANRKNGVADFSGSDKYIGVIDPSINHYIYKNNRPDTPMDNSVKIVEFMKELVYNLTPMKITQFVIPCNINKVITDEKLKDKIKEVIETAMLTLRDTENIDKVNATLNIIGKESCVCWFSNPFSCLSSILTTLMIVLKHLHNVIIDFIENEDELTEQNKKELMAIYEAYCDEGEYNYLESIMIGKGTTTLAINLERLEDNLY